MENLIKNIHTYVCAYVFIHIFMNHSAVYLKSTEHCKLVMFWLT